MENSISIYRRLAIYAAACVSVVILASFFIIGPNPMFMIGALTGCLLMIYKSVFWRNMPAGFSEHEKRPVRTFFFSMIIQWRTGLALFAAVMFDTLFLRRRV